MFSNGRGNPWRTRGGERRAGAPARAPALLEGAQPQGEPSGVKCPAVPAGGRGHGSLPLGVGDDRLEEGGVVRRPPHIGDLNPSGSAPNRMVSLFAIGGANVNGVGGANSARPGLPGKHAHIPPPAPESGPGPLRALRGCRTGADARPGGGAETGPRSGEPPMKPLNAGTAPRREPPQVSRLPGLRGVRTAGRFRRESLKGPPPRVGGLGVRTPRPGPGSGPGKAPRPL